mmetsp:Transcript_24731/g.70572  ORF Transcript_24731/g.70572 Transcript_24731/m.70572 type:complete len:258 (+) Transcript_24731:2262-3035(+)
MREADRHSPGLHRSVLLRVCSGHEGNLLRLRRQALERGPRGDGGSLATTLRRGGPRALRRIGGAARLAGLHRERQQQGSPRVVFRPVRVVQPHRGERLLLEESRPRAEVQTLLPTVVHGMDGEGEARHRVVQKVHPRVCDRGQDHFHNLGLLGLRRRVWNLQGEGVDALVGFVSGQPPVSDNGEPRQLPRRGQVFAGQEGLGRPNAVLVAGRGPGAVRRGPLHRGRRRRRVYVYRRATDGLHRQGRIGPYEREPSVT